MGLLTIINIVTPIKKHYETLKDDAHWLVILVIYFLLPIGISAILLFVCKIQLSLSFLNTLIAVFSIFIGFSINALILLLGRKREENQLKNKLLVHTTYNTIYELIIGLIILIYWLFFTLFYDKMSEVVLLVLSFGLLLLLLHFILTLLMIARRIYFAFYIKTKEWEI